jgi:hypothetical protein
MTIDDYYDKMIINEMTWNKMMYYQLERTPLWLFHQDTE